MWTKNNAVYWDIISGDFGMGDFWAGDYIMGDFGTGGFEMGDYIAGDFGTGIYYLWLTPKQ